MSRSSSRLLTLSALVYATNSIMVAQQPAPSPSRTIIKAVETTTAVVKKHPEFLDKIDVTASDIIVTAKKRADIIKNEIPTDERKAIEKAVKEEAEEAYAEIKNIFKHRSDRIKNKVDAVIGSDSNYPISRGFLIAMFKYWFSVPIRIRSLDKPEVKPEAIAAPIEPIVVNIEPERKWDWHTDQTQATAEKDKEIVLPPHLADETDLTGVGTSLIGNLDDDEEDEEYD